MNKDLTILLLFFAGCSSYPRTVSISYYAPVGRVPMEVTIAAISLSLSDSLYNVEGIVRDSTIFGNIVGVNISIAHTKRRATTDTAGTFKLDGLRLQDVLLFDSHGFRKKNVLIQDVLRKKTLKW